MKKILVLFAVLSATSLVSAALYSVGNKAGNNSRETIKYCAFNKAKGICEEAIKGDACYLVNADCSWMDEEDQPDA